VQYRKKIKFQRAGLMYQLSAETNRCHHSIGDREASKGILLDCDIQRKQIQESIITIKYPKEKIQKILSNILESAMRKIITM